MEEIKKIWERQAKFNKLLGNEAKTLKEREVLTKEFILHLITEAVEVLNEVNWKMHRKKQYDKYNPVNEYNLKEELIDVWKYLLSIMQFWNITPEQFIEEFHRKSDVVEQRYNQEKILNLIKEKKIIGIDIDGVLADYPKSFINFAEKETGIKFNIKGYDISEKIGKIIGVEKAKKIKEKYRISGQKRFIPVIENSQKALKILSKKYKIVLLSARPIKQYKRIFPDTIEWLKKNNFNYDAILWDEKKEEKVIKEFPNMKFMVEDVKENANKIAKKGYKVYLINKTYNRGKVEKNVTRVKNWEEILCHEKMNL